MTTQAQPNNVFGLNNGDTVWIGENEFTFTTTEDIHGKPGGFVTAFTGHSFPYGDGYSQYSVDEKGRVNCCGAIIGEIRNGEYEEYERVII